MGWTEELKWLNYRDSEILTDSFRVAANMSPFGLWIILIVATFTVIKELPDL